MNKVFIVVSDDDYIPKKATNDSAGYDLYAAISENTLLQPMKRILIPIGFKIAIPSGYEAQIRSRSGYAWEQGVIVLNSPGTIDSDYRDEVQVILMNFGEENFIITPKMRIAQMLICKLEQYEFVKSKQLDKTSRDGGFGSTGNI